MTEDRNLLSLELLPSDLDNQPEGIFATLRKAIANQVKRDGIKKDAILPSEIEADVFEMAVNYIYDDVAEFYYWIFGPDEQFGRYQYLTTQPTQGGRFAGSVYNLMKRAVLPVVEDNLDAMREADEITPEQDVAGLSEKITDSLTAYIMNWQDWFYDRKVDDDIDAYYDYLPEHAEIYSYSDYADLTNNPGDNQYDEVSDVPHLS